jgi:hypothetical protein
MLQTDYHFSLIKQGMASERAPRPHFAGNVSRPHMPVKTDSI